ncbi:uncharacterized protein SAPINGB_P005454 [Magnusiomyces paraingens]|uniref:Uncharacterized protein n=1 Tax=Magnusiomyces paraingens TaxID=2606893 RepID=A0A5E8BZP6_9ASCO|nr:uncharacterized protein SAPINGB_P005454 [Saprochaete ingens]VVT56967.1 unnamed protein product [Saprochaete ingens]
MFSWISSLLFLGLDHNIQQEEEEEEDEPLPDQVLPDQSLDLQQLESQEPGGPEEEEDDDEQPQQSIEVFSSGTGIHNNTMVTTLDEQFRSNHEQVTCFSFPKNSMIKPSYKIRLEWERKRQNFRHRNLKNKNYFPSLEKMRQKRREREIEKKLLLKAKLKARQQEDQEWDRLREESEKEQEEVEQEMKAMLIDHYEGYDESNKNNYENFYLNVFGKTTELLNQENDDNNRVTEARETCEESFYKDCQKLVGSDNNWKKEKKEKKEERGFIIDQEFNGSVSFKDNKSHKMESFNSDNGITSGRQHYEENSDNNSNDEDDDDIDSDDSSDDFSAVISASLLGHTGPNPFVAQHGGSELVTLLEQPTT